MSNRDTIWARARVRYPEKLKFRAEKGKYGDLLLPEIFYRCPKLPKKKSKIDLHQEGIIVFCPKTYNLQLLVFYLDIYTFKR